MTHRKKLRQSTTTQLAALQREAKRIAIQLSDLATKASCIEVNGETQLEQYQEGARLQHNLMEAWKATAIAAGIYYGIPFKQGKAHTTTEGEEGWTREFEAHKRQNDSEAKHREELRRATALRIKAHEQATSMTEKWYKAIEQLGECRDFISRKGLADEFSEYREQRESTSQVDESDAMIASQILDKYGINPARILKATQIQTTEDFTEYTAMLPEVVATLQREADRQGRPHRYEEFIEQLSALNGVIYTATEERKQMERLTNLLFAARNAKENE